MLLTPTGKPADTIDRIMLLAIWANYLQEKTNQTLVKKSEMIVAGIGKPTFPVNIDAVKAAKKYWDKYFLKSEESRRLIASSKIKANNSQSIVNSAINYGDPRGNKQAREKMARALTRWYHNTTISPNHVLFTVGGAAALRVISNVFNKEYPKSRIITPLPYYSLYAELFGKDNLHVIDVMQTAGYRLTAENFAVSLTLAENLAEKDQRQVSAFLMCDPNNPLGTVIDKNELIKIVEILKNSPNILIILDEAYAEMCFTGGRHTSLLAIATELQDRIILIRSATKALSAAGERMGVIVTSDESLMTKFIQENIKLCGHAPLSLQHAFSEAMDKLDKKELEALEAYYKPQIDYVIKRLENMGAAMPDSCYKIEGSFYALANLSDLLGLELESETEKALNKTGKITTDEDIAYYLLFKDRIMIAPLSYFCLAGNKGYMRITCSNSDQTITLMDRLETRLQVARKNKQDTILQQLKNRLDEVNLFNIEKCNELHSRMLNITEAQTDINHCTACELKENNLLLNNLLLETNRTLAYLPGDRHSKEAVIIQSFFRRVLAQKKYKELQSEQVEREKQWRAHLDELNSLPWRQKEKILASAKSDDFLKTLKSPKFSVMPYPKRI